MDTGVGLNMAVVAAKVNPHPLTYLTFHWDAIQTLLSFSQHLISGHLTLTCGARFQEREVDSIFLSKHLCVILPGSLIKLHR